MHVIHSLPSFQQQTRAFHVHVRGSLFVLLRSEEGIGYLLAAVDGGDEHEESAARDDEAEGAGGGVVLVVCVCGVSENWGL